MYALLPSAKQRTSSGCPNMASLTRHRPCRWPIDQGCSCCIVKVIDTILPLFTIEPWHSFEKNTRFVVAPRPKRRIGTYPNKRDKNGNTTRHITSTRKKRFKLRWEMVRFVPINTCVLICSATQKPKRKQQLPHPTNAQSNEMFFAHDSPA